ncbi:MAG: adenosylhomocysteinase [Candidatus Omnitrophica bacterium]|nr:adenosylhomocysteinase [Candidatus Omnitrophota bacterium]
MSKFDVKNSSLAPAGKKRILWAERQMPVLGSILEDFKKKKPLRKLRISACLHVTTETANLMRTLQAGGADIVLCASNPLSTQDDVAASLVKDFGIRTFAKKGENSKTYYRHIFAALEHHPHITMDDGADLVSQLHGKKKALVNGMIGGTEETTTGVIRLRSLEKKGLLRIPIFAVNDADTKHLFDNRYGTGQSTIDGILRATNVLLSGSTFVVAGYGWCGRGLASRARGMGSHVIVTETDPLRALEASMDGFEVMSMKEAARKGDIFVTVTGNLNVIRREHFLAMKDGAIVANSGHFNAEVDIPALKRLTKARRVARPYVEEFALRSGRRIFLVAEGRLVNLSTAEGHPASVMDMSFANQALCAEVLAQSGRMLEKRVYKVPAKIDAEVAKRKLQAMKITIDNLTPEQKHYLSSWELGT